MNKLLAALVATVFATAGAFATDAPMKDAKKPMAAASAASGAKMAASAPKK